MKSRRTFLSQISAVAALTGCATSYTTPTTSASATSYFMYVGTYTGGLSQGIYAFVFTPSSGRWEPLGLVAASRNPTFLAVHPQGKYLFSANETGEWNGRPGGYVSSFSIDPASGRLSQINEVSSGGGGPCHLNVDATGRNVLVANYGGGSCAAIPLMSGGSLAPATSFHQHRGSSVNPNRQKEPHGHSINLSPDNRFAFVADLGLDQILIYRFDATRGILEPNDPPFVKTAPGAGPRHFTFHPSGRFAYVINELTCTVTAYAYDAKNGVLSELQTISTLPPGEKMQSGYSTAEVRAHPNGKFLYGSNRGHDTLVAFAIGSDGRLSWIENTSTQGKTPRNFCIDPTGRFIAVGNQNSDLLVILALDPATGRLSPTGQSFTMGAPVCMRFVPRG